MKHIFSSGELLYRKNVRELEEGKFTAESIEYDDVEQGIEYYAIGQIEDKKALVKFQIKEDECDELSFKYSIKILMQSDLIQADWKSYSIEYL